MQNMLALHALRSTSAAEQSLGLSTPAAWSLLVPCQRLLHNIQPTLQQVGIYSDRQTDRQTQVLYPQPVTKTAQTKE